MANRFYTILIVPEKTSQVRRFVIPAWLFRSAAIGLALFTLTGAVMVMDYWYVMNQVGENKSLRLENRRLRQQVQVFRNKMDTIESTMERVKTFATRLKVITNLEDRNNLLQSLNRKTLPDSATNIGPNASTDLLPDSVAPQKTASNQAKPKLLGDNVPAKEKNPAGMSALGTLIAMNTTPGEDPEDMILRRDYHRLDMQFEQMNTDSLYVEQMLQDEYELLADRKNFLAALPTIKPAQGVYTSGFGVRTDPVTKHVRIHEGLDIANVPGTPIHAPADGVVEFAGVKSGYGNTVMINHGYGLETLYGHTEKILVHFGEHVHRGQVIALMGSTGWSTGPHCHYEVHVNGTPVDPLSYILQN